MEELAAMVLSIKSELCQRPGYGKDPASWEVYEAITRHGVRSVEEFEAWRRTMVEAGH